MVQDPCISKFEKLLNPEWNFRNVPQNSPIVDKVRWGKILLNQFIIEKGLETLTLFNECMMSFIFYLFERHKCIEFNSWFYIITNMKVFSSIFLNLYKLPSLLYFYHQVLHDAQQSYNTVIHFTTSLNR